MTSKFPPLPSFREVWQQLRALHTAFAHPDAGEEYVCLVLEHEGTWSVCAPNDETVRVMAGWELVPGDGKAWDAVGAAHRLLAAAADELERFEKRAIPCEICGGDPCRREGSNCYACGEPSQMGS